MLTVMLAGFDVRLMPSIIFKAGLKDKIFEWMVKIG